MNVDAVVQVFGTAEGSGYLIAPTLALTADHVVTGRDEAQIRRVGAVRSGDAQRQPARVVWRNADDDIALLETAAQVTQPVRLGRLAGKLPVPIDMLGFPDATLADDRRREALPVMGDCHPGSGVLRGRMQLRVSSLQPTNVADWRGLSGAAIFAGGCLVGVVTSVPRKIAGALQGISIEHCLASSVLAEQLRRAGVVVSFETLDADAARPFGALGMQEVRGRYTAAVLASFRLDGAGLAVDGSTAHALTLSQAYAGGRFTHQSGRDTLLLADLAAPTRRRIVLSGEPGTGKSITLRQWLAEVVSRDGRVPALIRLADLALSLGKRDPVPADFVRMFAARALELGIDHADERFFRRLLAHGDFAIGLDGFDEVGDKNRRERVARAIGVLSDAAPCVRLFVTSRPSELETTPLPRSTIDESLNFVRLKTVPFDGTQARGFLRVCFDDRGGALWGRIRSDEQLRGLTETPLLLTLLAMLAERERLPSGRFEIHDAVITTAVETWVQQRGQSSETAARTTLEQLALAMMDRDVPAAPMLRDDALRALSGTTDVAGILDWLVRSTGILIQSEIRGAKLAKATLQFAHLQLQEHLAGCGLARGLYANENTAREIAMRSRARSHWREAHRAAAAWLARNNGESVIEAWAGRVVSLGRPKRALERQEVALRAAIVLGEADAAFCPAEKVTARVLAGIDLHYRDTERIDALCGLVPRAAALDLVREVAFQTEVGRTWLGGGANVYQGSSSTTDCYGVARCARLLCEHRPSEASECLRLIEIHAPRTADMWPWVQLADVFERHRGRGATNAFLQSLAYSDTWRMDATSDDVARLMDRIDLAGYPELARTLAEEGTRFPVTSSATRGFVEWLEAHVDESAFAPLDDYYDRARQVIEGEHAHLRVSSAEFPLWPARDTDTIHRLRLAALHHIDTAWRVMSHEPYDPRYDNDYRAAARRLFEQEEEGSRVRGLARMLGVSGKFPMGEDILLNALGSAKFRRSAAHLSVPYLVARGHGAEVRARLEAIRADATTQPAARNVIDSLLELCSGGSRPA